MISVIGGGFAGSEAAWAIAQRGGHVTLWEMRPERMTGAHQTGLFAELVCSNSFKSKLASSPAGVLKTEMAALGSLILECAPQAEVPGGEALAVDREIFSNLVSQRLESHPHIKVERRHAGPVEVEEMMKQGPVIIATGPLTSPELAQWLKEKTGQENLYFYDAVSPTVDASTIDYDKVFAQSRYDKGGDDYINCPFDKEPYYAFVEALVTAERAMPHGVAEEETLEKLKYFAGCTPIEVIAEKGARSLAFGNFKPVGLTDPKTGRRPYAALQLRPENRSKTLYSLVACQNRLKWNEQKRVFRMVPGLENAEFVRFGVIHRNTYIKAPEALDNRLQLLANPGIFLAGQLTGVEGYVESAAMGIYAGINALGVVGGRLPAVPPRSTAYGSLLSHLGDDTPREFAPMNTNWGLFPAPELETRDKGVKRGAILAAAAEGLSQWLDELNRWSKES